MLNVNEYLIDREAQLKELIAEHNERTQVVASFMEKWNNSETVIIEVLRKLHLTIEKLNFVVHENNNSGRFTFEGISDGKFRFISFKGYDSRGRGKNHEQITTKARKMEQVFADAGITFRVSVNEFSLEESKNTNRNRVLFEMIIDTK